MSGPGSGWPESRIAGGPARGCPPAPQARPRPLILDALTRDPKDTPRPGRVLGQNGPPMVPDGTPDGTPEQRCQQRRAAGPGICPGSGVRGGQRWAGPGVGGGRCRWSACWYCCPAGWPGWLSVSAASLVLLLRWPDGSGRESPRGPLACRAARERSCPGRLRLPSRHPGTSAGAQHGPGGQTSPASGGIPGGCHGARGSARMLLAAAAAPACSWRLPTGTSGHVREASSVSAGTG
jgi:hypothetical protein